MWDQDGSWEVDRVWAWSLGLHPLQLCTSRLVTWKLSLASLFLDLTHRVAVQPQ